MKTFKKFRSNFQALLLANMAEIPNLPVAVIEN